MKGRILIVAFVILLLAIVFFIGMLFYEYREGDYPYIYNNNKSRYKYYFEYIDGTGIDVITYSDALRRSEGNIISGIDDVYSDISQDCYFILGRYDSIYDVKDRKASYFLIDKRENKVYLSLSKEQINDEVRKRNLAIDIEADNTRRISDRKQIYEKCGQLKE